jgi:hypothetical protein
MKAVLAAAVALLVLALGVTVGVIAAGGSGGEPRETGDTGEATPERLGGQRPDPEALEEFRDCIRDRGVELPEPGSGLPPDLDDEKLRAAIDACRDKLPSGLGPPIVQ